MHNTDPNAKNELIDLDMKSVFYPSPLERLIEGPAVNERTHFNEMQILEAASQFEGQDILVICPTLAQLKNYAIPRHIDFIKSLNNRHKYTVLRSEFYIKHLHTQSEIRFINVESMGIDSIRGTSPDHVFVYPGVAMYDPIITILSTRVKCRFTFFTNPAD